MVASATLQDRETKLQGDLDAMAKFIEDAKTFANKQAG